MDDDDKVHKADEERVSIADPFARRLIESYLRRRQRDFEILRASLAKKDFELIRVKGHNLCGSGSAYGLDRISELGRSLQDAATDENEPAIAEIIDSLEEYIRKLHIA